MATDDIKLPAGYEDAKPSVAAAPAAKVALPAGYEDARAAEPPGTKRPPAQAAQATGIGPRKSYEHDPFSISEDFLHPTEAYLKEHPFIGGLGERLRHLRETFEPGVMAAGTLSLAPGGIVGESEPIAQRPSVPSVSSSRMRLPSISEPTNYTPRGTPAPRLEKISGPNEEPAIDREIRTRTQGPVEDMAVAQDRARARIENEEEARRSFWEAKQRLARVGAGDAGTKSTETQTLELEPVATVQTEKAPPAAAKPERLQHVDIGELANNLAGVKPLRRDVPLREQLTSRPAAEEVDPIKARYPDPAVRQMVRANGERVFQAANGDPDLVKELHDLTRVELRQALINAGEDMGQKTVSNSKFAGEGSISREEAFNRLLDRGASPRKIVDLAKGKETAAPSLVPEEAPRVSNLAAKRATRERAARIREARQ